jgi:hypothetical protein
MPFPWLQVLDAVIGVTDLARSRKIRKMSRESADQPQQLEAGGRPGLGGLEARLAGVVVAALKEAFERDTHRLELERDQLEAERLRAERALASSSVVRRATAKSAGCGCLRAWRWPAGSGRCSFRRGCSVVTRSSRGPWHRVAAPARGVRVIVRRAVAGRGVGEPARRTRAIWSGLAPLRSG